MCIYIKCHFDCRMTHKVLHRFYIHSRGDQPSAKRMPESMRSYMRQLIIMYFIITLNNTTECGLDSIRQQRIAILCNKHKIPIAVD